MTTPLHPTLAAVTTRIEQRSVPTRQAYLDVLAQAKKPGPYRGGMGCANAAHAYAAMPANDKLVLRQERQPNVGVITAYNDMLSAHQPYEHYPEKIRMAARAVVELRDVSVMDQPSRVVTRTALQNLPVGPGGRVPFEIEAMEAPQADALALRVVVFMNVNADGVAAAGGGDEGRKRRQLKDVPHSDRTSPFARVDMAMMRPVPPAKARIWPSKS